MTDDDQKKDLEHYLRLSTWAQGALWGHNSNVTYTCEEFVLTYGFKLGPRVDMGDRPRGIPKQCFKNAFELMLTRQDLIYCEGFALSTIPILHAWCVDESGRIYDNTWLQNRHNEVEYIGVPFDRKWVQNQVEKSGVYGVIDDYKSGWPLLKWNGKPTFLHRKWRDRLAPKPEESEQTDPQSAGDQSPDE